MNASSASGALHVRPDPVQPRLRFRTLQYNPLLPLSDLADQLCALTEEPQKREILLLSQGFGAKIVAHALDRCMTHRVHHVYLNADETNGYSPPSTAYYSFGKNDLYRIQEQQEGAPLQAILEETFYPDPTLTLQPWRSVQWNWTPEAAGLWWQGDARLRSSKPFHFLSSTLSLFPTEGTAFRFGLLVFIAGLTVNQEYFDHWSQERWIEVGPGGERVERIITCPYSPLVFDGLWLYASTDGLPSIVAPTSLGQVTLPKSPSLLPPGLQRYFQQVYVRDGWGNVPPDTSASSCGNRKVDPGEECDPPTPAQCDASCKRISRCGNNQLDPGEQCEQGNRVACLCRYDGIHMVQCQPNCKIPSCDHEEPEPEAAGSSPVAPGSR